MSDDLRPTIAGAQTTAPGATDNNSQRLCIGYCQAISEAPFRIAPERADELQQTVFGGQPCDLIFENGPANFMAHVGFLKVEARFAALLSLWATARASLQLAVAIGTARRAGEVILDVSPGSAAHEAFALVEAARNLIRNDRASWPPDLPIPDHAAVEKTLPWYFNNVFLGATGWALLHEVAHLTLNHEKNTTVEILRRQEFEADSWATRWVLEKSQDPLESEFRIFCVATGLAWLGLLTSVRRDGPTHPPASQRLLNCAADFVADDLSPALEMAGDVLKAIFAPSTQLEFSEHPAEAFEKIAMHLRGSM